MPQCKTYTSADNRSEAEQKTNWTTLTEGAPLFRDVCELWSNVKDEPRRDLARAMPSMDRDKSRRWLWRVVGSLGRSDW